MEGSFACTFPKTNMEPKNKRLEDDCPFQRKWFSGSMLIFLGSKSLNFGGTVGLCIACATGFFTPSNRSAFQALLDVVFVYWGVGLLAIGRNGAWNAVFDEFHCFSGPGISIRASVWNHRLSPTVKKSDPFSRNDCCMFFVWNTVDGSEIRRSSVEVGSLSHHLRWFIHPRWLVGFLPPTVTLAHTYLLHTWVFVGSGFQLKNCKIHWVHVSHQKEKIMTCCVWRDYITNPWYGMFTIYICHTK